VRRWPGNAWTWARPRQGHGREVREAGGDWRVGFMGQREGIREMAVNTDEKGPPGSGERMGASARGSAPTGLAHRAAGGREGERERVRGRGRLLTGGVHLSDDAGARACGLAGLKWPFLFPGNF
jgi:hypothetical protein